MHTDKQGERGEGGAVTHRERVRDGREILEIHVKERKKGERKRQGGRRMRKTENCLFFFFHCRLAGTVIKKMARGVKTSSRCETCLKEERAFFACLALFK